MLRKIKKIVLTSQFYTFLLAMCFLAIVPSCTNEIGDEIQPVISENSTPMSDSFAFSKEMLVFDELQSNSIKLRISTNDPSLLDVVNEKNFTLGILFEKESEESDFDNFISSASSESEFDIKQAIRIEVIEQHLSDGALGFKLTPSFIESSRWPKQTWLYDMSPLWEGLLKYRVKRNNGYQGTVWVSEQVNKRNNSTGVLVATTTVTNHEISCKGCSYYSPCFDAYYSPGFTVEIVYIWVTSKWQNYHTMYYFTAC